MGQVLIMGRVLGSVLSAQCVHIHTRTGAHMHVRTHKHLQCKLTKVCSLLARKFITENIIFGPYISIEV